MCDVVIIPAYKPDGTLVSLVDELSADGLKVLVVNDGSGEEYDSVFRTAAQKAEVVNCPVNLGKGAALKRGITELSSRYPDCGWFITADSDGQHRVEDILRVRDELHRGSDFVLTVRKRRKNIPTRSRVGNALSRYIYTVLTGHYFSDNQSGLRGFSVNNAQWLTRVGGEKYDYEMNMLYYADKQGITITTIQIESIYIDGNKSSHFDPVNDTLRIYKRLFLSAWVTFATILLAESLMIIVSVFFDYRHCLITIPSVGLTVAFCNVLLNRFVAFREVRYGDWTRNLIYTVMRYAAYTAGCIILSIFRLPVIVSFNIVALLVVPLEYLMHKMLHSSRYRDINKESSDG